MGQYNDRETAPLKFHKFNQYFYLPATIIISLTSLVPYLSLDWSTFGFIHALVPLLIVVHAVLAGATIVGFINWDKSSLITLFLSFLVRLCLFAILEYLGNGEDPAITTGTFLYCILTLVYYIKRKELFGYSCGTASSVVKCPPESTVASESPVVYNTTAENLEPPAQECDSAVQLDLDLDSTNEPIESPVKASFCKLCGGRIDGETKKCSSCGKQYFKLPKLNFTLILPVVLAVALLISFVWGLNQHEQVNEISKQIQELNDTIASKDSFIKSATSSLSTSNNELSRLRDKINFYEDCVVFVDDGSSVYHKYGCSHFKGRYFYAFNTESAIYQGFYECPYCF